MYREIVLSPEDRALHRFIWRSDQSQPWTDYQMQRVTFGVTASPYVAVKTLQQTAKDFGHDKPNASHHIQTSFYVDDFFAGADTAAAVITLRTEVTDILSKAGFHIKKWRSSSSKVLRSIPSELLEIMPDQELVDLHSASYPKALGLIWDSRQDSMATHVELPADYSSTKRGVVSDIAKTFDILGWLSPVILVMKLLYRQLWVQQLDWDKEVPDDLKLQHENWRNNLPLLAGLRMPRHYFSKKKPKTITLHGFSDASMLAFSAVVYIRATYSSGPPSSILVVSKTRVAPIPERSVPELELCGAHLLAKLLKSTSQTLGISMEQISAYSDSTIVLAWLDGKAKRYKLYVSNRICKTIKLLPPQHWHYVPTKQNPANCASRGISARELIDHPLWWHGPLWLQQQPLKIPLQPTASEQEKGREEEQKYEARTQQCFIVTANSGEILESRSNSLTTLIKITCWVRRFIAKAQKKRIPPDRKLSIAEGLAAEDYLLRRSQARAFSTELHHLQSKPPKPLPAKSRLLAFHPQFNKRELLCVGGRLSNSLLPEAQKHPVLLSASDTFTRLLFHHYHLELKHGGPTAILSHSGNLYSIIGARKLARSVCSKCTICRKAAAKAGPQLMGQLPPSRLDPDFVFFHTGIDYAGPFLTLAGHTRRPVELKTYLAVYVCFYTKAVHLELVRDATTTSVVACLSRFCGRRGIPLTIHSDNGSNLMGARNQLAELYSLLEDKETQNAIQSYLFSQKVTWETIPVKSTSFWRIVGGCC